MIDQGDLTNAEITFSMEFYWIFFFFNVSYLKIIKLHGHEYCICFNVIFPVLQNCA